MRPAAPARARRPRCGAPDAVHGPPARAGRRPPARRARARARGRSARWRRRGPGSSGDAADTAPCTASASRRTPKPDGARDDVAVRGHEPPGHAVDPGRHRGSQRARRRSARRAGPGRESTPPARGGQHDRGVGRQGHRLVEGQPHRRGRRRDAGAVGRVARHEHRVRRRRRGRQQQEGQDREQEGGQQTPASRRPRAMDGLTRRSSASTRGAARSARRRARSPRSRRPRCRRRAPPSRCRRRPARSGLRRRPTGSRQDRRPRRA